MFVTNWISSTKIQKISEITNFFRHYFLSRTEVRYRLLRLITLILPATSKGYSEDFLRKTDATMIALTRHDDSTYKQQR